MNGTIARAERRWRTRISWAVGLSWLALAGAAGFWGPLDRPFEAILVAGLAFLSGILIGLEKGGRRRRFLPIRGPGPRISQSSVGRERRTYRSYDVLENPFELTVEDAETVGRYALTKAPFVIGAAPEERDLRAGDDVWDATWILHTHDSAGRPTFLDAGSVIGMLSFVRAEEGAQAFQMLKDQIQASLPQAR